jgi:predicted metalloprotease with PDZ domain
MIQYFFSFNRQNNLIYVEIHFEKITSDTLKLHLPAWRPGRYQLQNFAKNILDFCTYSPSSKLNFQKTSANIWEIDTSNTKSLVVKYTYYANELNAGSSLVNNEIFYINPVNMCMFVESPDPIRVTIDCEEDLNVACGMPFSRIAKSVIFNPKDYHEFYDSPIILSKKLEHHHFTACKIPFHFWIQGAYTLALEKILKDLQTVAEYQINLFGGFPEKEFHFLLIIPYTSYYHGVEHRNSTVMVLGEQGVLTENSYLDLLGLASHELFHAWNIAKIRPKELLPYDYTKENYFTTCFVAEGFTTYFGDRTLYDSGVFSSEQYKHELETTFKRHFYDSDHASQSLLESSFDLWVDGYEKGTPNKKVSVYHKGAIATLILDAMIRRKFSNKKSMENVMQKLYLEFGNLNKGYSYEDIKRICEEVFEGDLSTYFKNVIEGNTPIFELTQEATLSMGWTLLKTDERLELTF